MKIAFVSGHGNVTFEEFITHYKPKIDEALSKGHDFVLGDFRGADVLTLEYLKDKTDNVVIYHCFNKPRYRVDVIGLKSKDWIYKGGFKSDEERDAMMTVVSDYDIAWVKEGKESSGTAKNLQRRNK